MHRTPRTTSGAQPQAFSTPLVSRVSNGTPARSRQPALPPEHGQRIPAPDTVTECADVLILGAGTAGLICAYEAGRRGLRVLLLESSRKPGRKLAISGGGRANFSNRSVTQDDYLCRPKPEFCRYALAALPTETLLRRMRAWRLPVEERDHGRLFLKVPALRLVHVLEDACADYGCHLICPAEVRSLQRENDDFIVHAGEYAWRARAVVLALGSPAWPQAGGSHAGWRLASMLGHTLVPARPALVPFRLSNTAPLDAALRRLAGISLPARLTLTDAADGKTHTFEDDLLFTHTGLSGPLVLGASLFWRDGQPLELDLLPDQNTESLLDTGGARTPRTILRRLLPQRLIDAVVPPELAQRKAAELSRQARRQLAATIHSLCITPCGTEGMDKAEACSGGVDTSEVDPRTMESRLIPRLHIIGEMLDVTGRLGGYNLHWAWASGTLAGRAVLTGADGALTGCKTMSPRRAR